MRHSFGVQPALASLTTCSAKVVDYVSDPHSQIKDLTRKSIDLVARQSLARLRSPAEPSIRLS